MEKDMKKNISWWFKKFDKKFSLPNELDLAVTGNSVYLKNNVAKDIKQFIRHLLEVHWEAVKVEKSDISQVIQDSEGTVEIDEKDIIYEDGFNQAIEQIEKNHIKFMGK